MLDATLEATPEAQVDIKQAFQTQRHNAKWLDRYLEFLDAAPEPTTTFDRHHILPKSVFPKFASLKANPWNCAHLRPGDHVLAHYYLFRALPGDVNIRWAFKMMVGTHYLDLVEQGYDEQVVREIAEAYEQVRQGKENNPSVLGWVRLYRGEDEATVAPPDMATDLLSSGWSSTPPSRQWVNNGVEDRKVKLKDVEDFLGRGYSLGRIFQHSLSQRDRVGEHFKAYHERERTQDEPYSYLPHGDDHPRCRLGISEETKAKISRALEGRKQTPEHIEKRRAKLIGQKKPWRMEKRILRSLKMKGQRPNMSRLGAVTSEDTKAKMSASHLRFYREDPTAVAALDAARPRGEAHWTYGKERDGATRAKISESLTGKVQSDATKQKRADALALARLPTYTPEEIALFDALRAGSPPPFKLTHLSKAAQTVVQGLRLILTGGATDANRRYWRQAANWIKLTGR